MMFVLDTNIFIDYAKGESRVVDFIQSAVLSQESFAVPTVCVVEFLSYPKLLPAEKEKFLFQVSQMGILGLDYNNALIAANLKAVYSLKTVDSVIAAAVMSQNAVLVSRDKDFRRIKEIEIIDL